MIFAGASDVFDNFSEVTAIEFGSAFAGRTYVGDRKALVVGHGDERGLAIARVAFDADLAGVDGFVGLEIVERATGSPSPGTQRSPVVKLARLALVAQADDALSET